MSHLILAHTEVWALLLLTQKQGERSDDVKTRFISTVTPHFPSSIGKWGVSYKWVLQMAQTVFVLNIQSQHLKFCVWLILNSKCYHVLIQTILEIVEWWQYFVGWLNIIRQPGRKCLLAGSLGILSMIGTEDTKVNRAWGWHCGTVG